MVTSSVMEVWKSSDGQSPFHFTNRKTECRLLFLNVRMWWLSSVINIDERNSSVKRWIVELFRIICATLLKEVKGADQADNLGVPVIYIYIYIYQWIYVMVSL